MVGVLLNVISDGVEVDVDASREAARVTLEQLFEQAAGA
jgi:hypothetical protein